MPPARFQCRPWRRSSARDLRRPASLLRQVVRFAAVGVASTVAYLLLFVALHHTLGAQTANLLALLLTAVANTAANRRFTFGVRGSARVARHQLEGLVVFGVALGITSGSLGVLHLLVNQPHHAGELAVLVAANLAATAIRFVLLRGWVFHPPAHSLNLTTTSFGDIIHGCSTNARGHAPPPHTPTTCRRRWDRPVLYALLVATAVLYLWGLGSSGWANDYYAAAVQAGTQDWKAWLFGSLDPGNAITVDKPPAAMWVMGLSARIFGFSPLSMLLPQALMGVGPSRSSTQPCAAAAVRSAGLLAGAVLALTPVAAVMFRYNNPDALLVLLLTAAAISWCARSTPVPRGGSCWRVPQSGSRS